MAAFTTMLATAKTSVRYMPSYRLEAMRPLNKEVCENIIRTVMEEALLNFNYTPKTSLQFCALVSEEIKSRIKAKDYDRNKTNLQFNKC
ncbi:uncharacterized protein LOC101888251 isoform X2 [Musca domestica]|uniref:Uncharacterized protein LOC101888251 isoform X2 n=1 Tax=Musca domestica TaxID=7370 RepID=A0ABM3VM69_MUSDO|nr:uncharacterized protein LOC131806591 isoform X2 [Musca domestica]XP_058987024.1 uncharacterized protein LOC101888251 isoform X2 [Musca domestica]